MIKEGGKLMKKISKKSIMKTVKKEYKEARDFCRGGHFRYYKMMIDVDDGAIWSDVFLDENNWKEYHSESIRQLENTLGYVHETEKGYVDDAVCLLREAGWMITD